MTIIVCVDKLLYMIYILVTKLEDLVSRMEYLYDKYRKICITNIIVYLGGYIYIVMLCLIGTRLHNM